MKERKDTVERIALQAHEKSEWSDTTEIKLTSAHFIFLTTEITVWQDKKDRNIFVK